VNLLSEEKGVTELVKELGRKLTLVPQYRWIIPRSVWAPDTNPSWLGTHREGVAARFRGGMS
jgi:hypothetical protein